MPDASTIPDVQLWFRLGNPDIPPPEGNCWRLLFADGHQILSSSLPFVPLNVVKAAGNFAPYYHPTRRWEASYRERFIHIEKVSTGQLAVDVPDKPDSDDFIVGGSDASP